MVERRQAYYGINSSKFHWPRIVICVSNMRWLQICRSWIELNIGFRIRGRQLTSGSAATDQVLTGESIKPFSGEKQFRSQYRCMVESDRGSDKDGRK